ncbi:hypothetical protein V6N12_058315 [Hibiscus sabdariffa]|uniref:Uncharacterized protein n=1 Tax=Hibiscus sabdariffa TaxID=183260 RepID=A0ABR2ERS2_9ROSI
MKRSKKGDKKLDYSELEGISLSEFDLQARWYYCVKEATRVYPSFNDEWDVRLLGLGLGVYVIAEHENNLRVESKARSLSSYDSGGSMKFESSKDLGDFGSRVEKSSYGF